ncbi:MAG: ABC transporter permease [Gammaproteobacteria bacterium]|nr:ABC transporter permease [Gammaproteobacteria bacterium]MDE0252451.1 ABC transporter permease [Gammaproteobacteria bacterium]MDE0402440.1 ABC transporter permease [Gammaproteobacteria bacterium]
MKLPTYHSRRERWIAILLIAPLVVFIGATFVAPLGSMLKESVYEAEVADTLSRTVALLNKSWDKESLPSEEIYRTLAGELIERSTEGRAVIGRVSTRVNRLVPGTRSVWGKTARKLRDVESTDFKTTLIDIDDRWGELELWHGIRKAGQKFFTRNYLHALDLKVSDEGNVVRVEEDKRVYMTLYWRTFYVAITVTILCLLLGYPIANAIANAPPALSKILLILVLVPFWTSLLARTSSWIVLLQGQGVINDILVVIGLVQDEQRLKLWQNMFATRVVMTQVLLPFMVLPIYSVLNSMSPSYMRAAASLGANPFQAFMRVYLPQSLPGVYAGCLLVFILALGYYITPALVGGPDGQLISNMIAYHVDNNNWGLGAAISMIVLVSVMLLYLLFDRWIGINKLKLS